MSLRARCVNTDDSLTAKCCGHIFSGRTLCGKWRNEINKKRDAAVSLCLWVNQEDGSAVALNHKTIRVKTKKKNAIPVICHGDV
jgi:hypothetical protein